MIYLLFPGQGSQYVGMAKDLLELPLAQKADDLLGFSLTSLMTSGPEETLQLTSNAQPAILLHSLLLFEKLKAGLLELGAWDRVRGTLGHSVGEYAALVAADVLKPLDAIKAVHYRGRYMQEATPVGMGGMMAVLKVPVEVIRHGCEVVSTEGSSVMPANYNEPGQIVVSGEQSALGRLAEWLGANYKEAHRTVMLSVSAPFHSEYMKPAALKLRDFFATLEWQKNHLPYVANINAKTYLPGTLTEHIKENLYQQSFGPVLWYPSIESLPSGSICFEVGPSKVLMGLARKIRRDITVHPLDGEWTMDDLRRMIS